MILVYILAGVILFLLLAMFFCFYLTFFASRKKKPETDLPVPPGEVYRPFREQMRAWILETRQLPREEVSITSFDGLTLRGFY